MKARPVAAVPASEAPPRPRTKPAEVRLDELMTAAEALFLAQGVEATTISDIAERAQVAKGTFYHYFTSKHDMLVALGERYTAQFLTQLQAAVAACDDGDWIGKLQAWVHANVATYVATYRTHDIVYTNHHHHDRANPARNAILDQLTGILEGGAAAGVWSLDAPRITALLIYSGVHGATDDLIVSPDLDSTQFAQQVSANCLRMLGVAPAE